MELDLDLLESPPICCNEHEEFERSCPHCQQALLRVERGLCRLLDKQKITDLISDGILITSLDHNDSEILVLSIKGYQAVTEAGG